MANLTFDHLRQANRARLMQFRNGQGQLVHSRDDGRDWSLSQWSNAVCGEVGEAANIVKKIERGDYTLEDAARPLADELADVAIYLDLLALRAGIDLSQAIVRKFNAVSRRVHSHVFLSEAEE